jgi:MSHA biogenesis protein MshK
MYNFIRVFLITSLFLSCSAHAELRDPTRPPEFIVSGTLVVAAWQLDAIIIGHDRQVAIINGQSIKLGEQIDGYRLIAISGNSVQLQGTDDKMTLFLLDNALKMDSKAN